MNSSGLKGFLKGVNQTLVKNSPTILTTIGVVGVLSTSVLAVRATPRAMQILEENKKVLDEEDNYILKQLHKAKITAPCYIPAIAVGTMTCGCIIAAHRVSARRSAAIASLYALTENSFREYQTKVIENFGEGKEQKIRDEIAKDKLTKNPPSQAQVVFTGNGDVLCYDAQSGRYFRSTIEKIRRIVNEVNYNLRSANFISLNEFYAELGLPSVELGEMVGWDINKGLLDPYFSSQITPEGEPCLVITLKVEPYK